MELTFVGADHEVTGSCHFISACGKRFIIDCGMEQGPDAYLNQDLPVNAPEIDYAFITHAHIDHSGLLPLLYSRGFRGEVYCTDATTELCDIMLKDSAHIQESEAEWKNRKAARAGFSKVEPMYTTEDAENVLKLFHPVPYHERLEISEGLSCRFIDAGHLLGSASIEFWLSENGNEKKIVFSGDIGNATKPLIKDPEYITEADYVVMESTYGDRDHKQPEFNDFAKALSKILTETFDKGGNVVIPAFSVGRTQEMLYFLRKIKEESLMTRYLDFPVYMDSPLAVEATHVFNENVADCFSETALALIRAGKNPIGFKGLYVAVSSDESKAINFDRTPKVIISASGMCEAGRIRHHLKHNLWRSESTIVFVGYQVPGTLGNTLLNGAKEVKLFGEEVSVNARIENLPGISGHADRTGLIKWAKAFSPAPATYFLVHGDGDIIDAFAADISKETGTKAYAPYSGDTFDLLTGERIREGVPTAPEKKKAKRVSSNVFERLVAAGKRLLHVITGCEGMANKDLGKFADQINALADKWER